MRPYRGPRLAINHSLPPCKSFNIFSNKSFISGILSLIVSHTTLRSTFYSQFKVSQKDGRLWHSGLPDKQSCCISDNLDEQGYPPRSRLFAVIPSRQLSLTCRFQCMCPTRPSTSWTSIKPGLSISTTISTFSCWLSH